jgi:hypothetical protein
MPRSPLCTYLEDHLAGATAGVALARRVAQHSEGARASKTLSEVAREIEADRETLKRLMSELGVRGSIVKNTIAWVSERVSRLKPNGRLRGDPRMQRLHELEALSLGIAGKLELWEALRVVPEATAFAEIDLDELEARARSQRERVERERMAAARAALSPRSNVVRLPEHAERNVDAR